MSETREGGTAAGAARWLVATRVPIWVLVLAIVVVAGGLGAALLLQRMNTVELGPAIAGAERIEVRIQLCNGEVDRRAINPRQAELDLEETLTAEGADEATVRVDRRDCPEEGDGSGSGG